ncbi:MAG: hypothetical protein SGPRY_011833, partial [Prymnesium sp.]
SAALRDAVKKAHRKSIPQWVQVCFLINTTAIQMTPYKATNGQNNWATSVEGGLPLVENALHRTIPIEFHRSHAWVCISSLPIEREFLGSIAATEAELVNLLKRIIKETRKADTMRRSSQKKSLAKKKLQLPADEASAPSKRPNNARTHD